MMFAISYTISNGVMWATKCCKYWCKLAICSAYTRAKTIDLSYHGASCDKWCFTIIESTLVLFLYILQTKGPKRYWLFWSSVSINLFSLCGASFFISTCCCVGVIIKILIDVILSQKYFTKGTVVRHCYTVAHIITLWCWFSNSALCWLLKISRYF